MAMSDTRDREIWGLLLEVAENSGTVSKLQEHLATLGITPSAAKVLRSLGEGGTRTMGDLAHAFACDPSNITSLVDSLEKAGLVEREMLPTDRRVRNVRLTDRGAEAYRVYRAIKESAPLALSRLDEHKKRQLHEALEALLDQQAGVLGSVGH